MQETHLIPGWRSSAEEGICYPLQYSSGEGNGTPLQYWCLENPMDAGAGEAAVHGVAKSRTRLEKEMVVYSSVLAWRIPGTGGAWWAAIYGVAQSRT